MKRREFLKRGALVAAGTAAAAAGVTIVGHAARGAIKLAALDEHEGATLLKMSRQIFPHDRLGDSHYWKVVEDLDREAATTAATAKLLRDGIANLDHAPAAKFIALEPDEQIVALKKIEGSPFFQKVQSTAIVSLYNNHEVWKQFGYPGASFPIGGYLHHGFNDLNWLPDPPEAASPKPV